MLWLRLRMHQTPGPDHRRDPELLECVHVCLVGWRSNSCTKEEALFPFPSKACVGMAAGCSFLWSWRVCSSLSPPL